MRLSYYCILLYLLSASAAVRAAGRQSVAANTVLRQTSPVNGLKIKLFSAFKKERPFASEVLSHPPCVSLKLNATQIRLFGVVVNPGHDKINAGKSEKSTSRLPHGEITNLLYAAHFFW